MWSVKRPLINFLCGSSRGFRGNLKRSNDESNPPLQEKLAKLAWPSINFCVVRLKAFERVWSSVAPQYYTGRNNVYVQMEISNSRPPRAKASQGPLKCPFLPLYPSREIDIFVDLTDCFVVRKLFTCNWRYRLNGLRARRHRKVL